MTEQEFDCRNTSVTFAAHFVLLIFADRNLR